MFHKIFKPVKVPVEVTLWGYAANFEVLPGWSCIISIIIRIRGIVVFAYVIIAMGSLWDPFVLYLL